MGDSLSYLDNLLLSTNKVMIPKHEENGQNVVADNKSSIPFEKGNCLAVDY